MGRTGVFITLSIVLERMQYEGVVDIFQTVRALRTQRPAMVQTEVRKAWTFHSTTVASKIGWDASQVVGVGSALDSLKSGLSCRITTNSATALPWSIYQHLTNFILNDNQLSWNSGSEIV